MVDHVSLMKNGRKIVLHKHLNSEQVHMVTRVSQSYVSPQHMTDQPPFQPSQLCIGIRRIYLIISHRQEATYGVWGFLLTQCSQKQEGFSAQTVLHVWCA
jgi:hypothetical protein